MPAASPLFSPWLSNYHPFSGQEAAGRLACTTRKKRYRPRLPRRGLYKTSGAAPKRHESGVHYQRLDLVQAPNGGAAETSMKINAFSKNTTFENSPVLFPSLRLTTCVPGEIGLHQV